jgi:UDP-glucose-4-epimerase GalE
MARILVTGGAGYIGSHTSHFLLRLGHDVTVADDLSKGYRHNVPEGRLRVVSLHDRQALDALFSERTYDAVIHFAAFIAVGESVREPELYFHNNVAGTLNLLTSMRRAGVRNIVFSSTAAVYGDPDGVPIPETAPLRPVSPYGESKLMIETALGWLDHCSDLRHVILRYFNACGADNEAGVGEEHEPETHLIPLIFRAIRTGQPLTVFGGDYPTPDGTCIRDYIHVGDLASAHAAGLDHLMRGGASGIFNAGTGQGHSVRQVIDAAERVTGLKVPWVLGSRRDGDPPELVADSTKLQIQLGWRPVTTSLDQMIASAWTFEQKRFGMA